MKLFCFKCPDVTCSDEIMIKTGLNNERTRVCLCPSGDAVHREEAAESSVSLYDLNFLRGSPLSWTPRGPLQPLCFTLSFSL